MILFQILLVAIVIVAAALAFRFLPGERSLALKRIIAILFVLAAAAAILFPGLLTAVANFFGIGRGTDLLLYLFIIAMLIFATAVVRAKARSDARVTELARAVALMEARLRDERPAPGAGGGTDEDAAR
ncbi:DUF2304 domain-containing protein [Leucobacter allii]|uniref:DUF2304 domain-containing protein n=1 Tax=Leucobacter allii TaxID=2932247 RepID=A0ABY4FN40_9MICO|nr:DUF2304 domain-containing protein [Leucobacter allii]UOQ57697.1 DUF2304 domain-containing protein [Leucobacter allii]UOR02241.1 DUF2304 domain-containing protein [Leucobacter allii]